MRAHDKTYIAGSLIGFQIPDMLISLKPINILSDLIEAANKIDGPKNQLYLQRRNHNLVLNYQRTKIPANILIHNQFRADYQLTRHVKPFKSKRIKKLSIKSDQIITKQYQDQEREQEVAKQIKSPLKFTPEKLVILFYILSH
jgi:hypothetical protein